MDKKSKIFQVFSGWRAIPRSTQELVESVRLLTTLRAAGWHLTLSNHARFTVEKAQPMLTYGSIGFLESFLTRDSRVLEFGTGGSTIWLASRACQVVSIEDDPRWANRIPALTNVDLRVVPCLGDWYNDSTDYRYSKAAAGDSSFDLIIIDGKARTDCARESLDLLASGGVIVLDDLHDQMTEPAVKILKASGLKFIEFWGLRPGSGAFGGTGIFINN